MLSQIVQEHLSSPRNAGRLSSFSHYGCSGVPGDGPYVEYWLEISDDKIVRMGQESNGCPTTMACASYVSMISLNRQPKALLELEPSALLLLIGGLPPGKERSASLAVAAIHSAVTSYLTETLATTGPIQ